MEEVRMKPTSAKHGSKHKQPSKNKNRKGPPSKSQPQELIPKRFLVGLPLDPVTQKILGTETVCSDCEMNTKFGNNYSEDYKGRMAANQKMLKKKYGEEFLAKGWNLKHSLVAKSENEPYDSKNSTVWERENLKLGNDQEETCSCDKHRDIPKIQESSEYSKVYPEQRVGHTKRKCAWATPPSSGETTGRTEKSDENMVSGTKEDENTENNMSSHLEPPEENDTDSETSSSTSASSDDDSEESFNHENCTQVKMSVMIPEIQNSSGDQKRLGLKSDKFKNTPGSSGDRKKATKDEEKQPVQKILIPEDYNHILEFFSAKNLTCMELQMYPDDPCVLNKFYRIKTTLGLPDWNLDREAIIDNLTEFVRLPVAIGFLVKCKIYRDRRGIDGGMFPTYVMQLENEQCKNTHLMSARKRKKTAKVNYLISVDPLKLVRTGGSIVGNLRGNVLGTQFTIYDGGDSPKKCLFAGGTPRQELGAIIYQQDILGMKGPRKMRFLLPAMVNETKRLERYPDGDHDSILANYKDGLTNGIMDLRNKPPLFNDHVQSFVLDFHGRVSLASIKNFQIIHPESEDYTILQFGRISEDVFNLDFRYPLCPLQAFGIVLSCFTSKLACD